MQNYSEKKLLLILAPLISSFAFGLDIYVPIVPLLVEKLQTTQFMVQLTLSSFVLMMGVGQLVMGPLADRYGRRKIVLISSILYTLGAICSAIAVGIYTLITARIIMAAGGCGLLVCAFAVVRDVCEGDKSAKMFSYLNSSIGMSPIFAPIIGGYLAYYFGWRAPFWFLIIWGIYAMTTIYFLLQETLPVEQQISFDNKIWARYYTIIKNKQFLLYTFAVSVGISMFFLFFSVSSFILIKELHVELEHFGYYFAFMGITVFAGSIISGHLSTKLGAHKTIFFAIFLVLIGGFSMLAWHYITGLTRMSFVIPMLPIGVGAACLMGAGAGLALGPYAAMAGTASAVLGCCEFLFASIVGGVVMHWPIVNTLPMAYAVIILGGCLVLLFYYFK